MDKLLTLHDVIEWTHYLTHDEAHALQELAQALPENPIICNIGAGNGSSTLAFMLARPDCTVFSVDIRLEPSPYGCLSGERTVLEQAGFVGDPRYHQIHSDSIVAGKDWSENYPFKLDMVFIDAGHQYHECKGDIEAWMPQIKPQGVLAVHDFEKEVKVWYGVDRAVREVLVGKYEEIARVDSLIAFRMP